MPAKRGRNGRRALHDDPKYLLARECKGVHVDPEHVIPGGAHSIGIGRKVVGGKPTNQVAIRHYVEKKRPAQELSAERAVPREYRFFSRARGREVSVPTDVIESPRPELEINPRDRLRPVPGGSSIGTPPPPGFIDAGTLGGWVWDLEDDTVVMLSNEHVLGTSTGDDVAQPGTLDGGGFPGDKIGEVKRGIPRSTTSVNTVDCAIGDPDSTATYQAEVIDIGPAVYAIDEAVEDMLVEKFGRTTEHTFGEVTDINVTTTLTSGHTFTDCMRVDVVAPSPDWSDGGDSGSLVFSQTPLADADIKPVVGLHFAGAGTHGIECKIANVFSALNLTTLCSGALAAFLDSLFESEESGQAAEAPQALRDLADVAARRQFRMLPGTFVRRERRLHGLHRPFHGISRDLQRRLLSTPKGRKVTELVDTHRAELLDLLVHNGDVRRSTVAALRPLVAGAVTTSDVLERVLTDRDLTRLTKLAKEVGRATTSQKLKTSLKIVEALGAKAAGNRVGDVFGIRV